MQLKTYLENIRLRNSLRLSSIVIVVIFFLPHVLFSQDNYLFVERTKPDSLFDFLSSKMVVNNLSSFMIDTKTINEQKLEFVKFYKDSISPCKFKYIVNDSIVIVEGGYENNMFNGIITQYNIFNNSYIISFQVNYLNNIKNGLGIFYSVNSFNKDNSVKDIYIHWICSHENGIHQGPQIFYNKDGSIESVEIYKDSKIINGKHRSGCKENYAIVKNRNGEIIKTWDYRDGRLYKISNKRIGEHYAKWYNRLLDPNIFFNKDCMGRRKGWFSKN